MRKTILLLVSALVWQCAPDHRCSDENFLTLDSHERVVIFRVLDGQGNVLWDIRRQGEGRLHEIRYGHVPAGFVQTSPQTGGPRRLTSGEQLFTETLTREIYLVHQGIAVGPANFCGGQYEQGPRSRWNERRMRPLVRDAR